MRVESNQAVAAVLVLVLLWFDTGRAVIGLVLVLQHSFENRSTINISFNYSDLLITSRIITITIPFNYSALFVSCNYVKNITLTIPFNYSGLFVKPWPNGLASRRKLKTWVYLRLRLARACVHLR